MECRKASWSPQQQGGANSPHHQDERAGGGAPRCGTCVQQLGFPSNPWDCHGAGVNNGGSTRVSNNDAPRGFQKLCDVMIKLPVQCMSSLHRSLTTTRKMQTHLGLEQAQLRPKTLCWCWSRMWRPADPCGPQPLAAPARSWSLQADPTNGCHLIGPTYTLVLNVRCLYNLQSCALKATASR